MLLITTDPDSSTLSYSQQTSATNQEKIADMASASLKLEMQYKRLVNETSQAKEVGDFQRFDQLSEELSGVIKSLVLVSSHLWSLLEIHYPCSIRRKAA